jgi:fission process protein 1
VKKLLSFKARVSRNGARPIKSADDVSAKLRLSNVPPSCAGDNAFTILSKSTPRRVIPLAAKMGSSPSKETDAPKIAPMSVAAEVIKREEDFTAPLKNEKLPEALQKMVDSEDTLMESIYDGKYAFSLPKPSSPCSKPTSNKSPSASESTDSNVRYAAYATRLRTILLSAHRYVAYTSDVGESFRPVAHPYLIKGAYGISWAYLIGDVSHEGYKAYLRQKRIEHPGTPGVMAEEATSAVGKGKEENVHKLLDTNTQAVAPGKVAAIDDYRSVIAQRAIFQSVASMGLPAFTIHSIVRYSGRALKDAKNMRIRMYGPIGVCLNVVSIG